MHPVKVPSASENLTTFSSRPQHKYILSQINTSAQQMRPFHNRGNHPWTGRKIKMQKKQGKNITYTLVILAHQPQLSQALPPYSEMCFNLKPRQLGQVWLKIMPDVNAPQETQWVYWPCWRQSLHWARLDQIESWLWYFWIWGVSYGPQQLYPVTRKT